jgi:sterol 14-demethylase
MDAEYSDGTNLSDHEITGMLVAAMFAGHHTSSVTTAWTLIELLRHPQFLEEVRAEIHGRYAEGEEYSFQSLRDLEKTEGAVKEALRIHPGLRGPRLPGEEGQLGRRFADGCASR